MFEYSSIALTLGLVALIEGIIILTFPHWTKIKIESLLKTRKAMRQLGLLEIILAMILLVLSLFLIK